MTDENDDAKIRNLALFWLIGWDAGSAGRAESTCPFAKDTEQARNWRSGWNAGLRRLPSDFKNKASFVRLGIHGLGGSDQTPT